jgi:nucleotide-binding universal stress UspA family protein
VKLTIVAGVHGSRGGAAALEFAADEAALRKTRLRIVLAWEGPVEAYSAGFPPSLDPAGADVFAPALDTETVDALGVRAEQVADDAVATVKKLHPSLEVEALAVAGQPADALIGHGAEAELIVVGRRGLGGFRSLLLRSVSQQVVQHATCPVVVVRPPTIVC